MEPLVIAEIGQGKGDPIYIARALDRAKQSGCWAGKIQLLQPDLIAQADAGVYWDERRPEIDGQRTTFATVGCLDYSLLPTVLASARLTGIELAATPFDLTAVDAMADCGMHWCKIASGDLTNRPLIDAAARAFPRGIILSTGAGSRTEIIEALVWIAAAGATPFAVLACTLSYPTQEEDANLGRIAELRYLRDQMSGAWHVGYSDHLVSPRSSLWAGLAGATVLEKHYTINDADRSVPDNAFAVGPRGMDEYVRYAREAGQLLGDGKLAPVEAEGPAKAGARRVLCTVRDLPAGHELAEDDVIALRPHVEGAFVPADLAHLVGRCTSDAISAGRPILLSAVT